MGVVSAAADAVVALFSLIMAVAGPLFDSQIVLPRCLYPAPLVDIHRWFIREFDHYLVADPPPFFRGLVWLELAFLWPVCVANLYCILARRRWAATTSLMAGVYMLTYLTLLSATSDGSTCSGGGPRVDGRSRGGLGVSGGRRDAWRRQRPEGRWPGANSGGPGALAEQGTRRRWRPEGQRPEVRRRGSGPSRRNSVGGDGSRGGAEAEDRAAAGGEGRRGVGDGTGWPGARRRGPEQRNRSAAARPEVEESFGGAAVRIWLPGGAAVRIWAGERQIRGGGVTRHTGSRGWARVCVEQGMEQGIGAWSTGEMGRSRRRRRRRRRLGNGGGHVGARSAILGDMLGSGRATPKLLQLYVPFVVFAVTAVLRGLCSCSALATAGSSSAQKKRV